jgi:CelD/BcsL family acetyltransferase involved in cellulose biosynthesis
VNWIGLAQDRNQWRALVNTVTNILFQEFAWEDSCVHERQAASEQRPSGG